MPPKRGWGRGRASIRGTRPASAPQGTSFTPSLAPEQGLSKPRYPHTLTVPASSVFVTLRYKANSRENGPEQASKNKRLHVITHGYEATAAFITLQYRPQELRLATQVKDSEAEIQQSILAETSGTIPEGSTLAVVAVKASTTSPAQDSAIDVNTPAIEDDQMAPVRDTNSVSASIKDVIQHLFDLQSQVHGYVPETREVLVENIIGLTQSLSHLQDLANSPQTAELREAYVAPELIDYVDDGRNPDIYTRDLVESVQRGNAVLNGKMEAFRGFSDIFAAELRKELPETKTDVDRVMTTADLARGHLEDQTHTMGNGNR